MGREMESADQLLSLGPAHPTSWSQLGILPNKTRWGGRWNPLISCSHWAQLTTQGGVS
jgi:hypothetical protein